MTVKEDIKTQSLVYVIIGVMVIISFALYMIVVFGNIMLPTSVVDYDLEVTFSNGDVELYHNVKDHEVVSDNLEFMIIDVNFNDDRTVRLSDVVSVDYILV